MLLRRISRLPWGVAYVPKGPLLDWTDPAAVEQVISGIEAQARRSRAIFVKIDPDVSPDEPAGQALIALLKPARLALLGRADSVSQHRAA